MQNAPTTVPRQTFRSDIHRLRGIAIFLIVATHCVTSFSWHTHPAALQLALDIFDNSTLIFVFISGYLFQHTASDFHYLRYLKTKLRNVAAPYLIAATPGIVHALLYAGSSRNPDVETYSALGKAAYLFIYGGSQLNYALWFIPVICIYYVISPLFVWVMRHPRAYLMIALLVPASIFIHRPTYSHGHNLALAFYFLPVYLTGMMCGQFDRRITTLLDRHLGVYAGFVAAFIALHYFLSSHHGNYSKTSLSSLNDPSGWVDWMFIQKTLLTFLLWGLLRRVDHLRFSLLDLLATVSFTVYFFHLYVLTIAGQALNIDGMEVNTAAFLGLLLVAVAVPMLMAVGFKQTVPRWSRSLVGS